MMCSPKHFGNHPCGLRLFVCTASEAAEHVCGWFRSPRQELVSLEMTPAEYNIQSNTISCCHVAAQDDSHFLPSLFRSALHHQQQFLLRRMIVKFQSV